jgi:hypothetical protein
VLQAKEHTQTPYPFVVFTFGLAIESLRSLGVHHASIPFGKQDDLT